MQKTVNKTGCYFILLLSLILFYAKFQPLSFHPTNAGLDPSWQASLALAVQNGWLFGTDVVFTGGPLSSIYTRQYVGAYTYAVAIFSIMIVFYLAVSTLRILRAAGDIMSNLVVILLIYVCYISSDTFLLMIPMLSAIIFLGHERKSATVHAAAGSFLGGVLALAKFSTFPLSIVTVLLLDILTLRRKAIPVQTLSLCAGLWTGYAVSGQPLSQLPAFLVSSLEVSSGYSAAMSLSTQIQEVAVWLVLATIFVGFLAWRSYVCRYLIDPAISVARILIICAFLLIAWKAGFVRHDLHSLIAWSGLSLAIIMAGVAGLPQFRPAWWAMLALACVSMIPPYVLLNRASGHLPFVSGLETARILTREIGNTYNLIVRPAEWRRKLDERNAASLAEIRSKLALPLLDGTVDIIPSEQSDLIANDLQFTPRPTVQEYTTYSPKLIARNRAFFEGSHAPDYLIMAPGSIDGRHPASAEGSLWPLFFATYQAEIDLGRNLVLKKRATPIDNIEGVPTEVEAKIGEHIPVPDHDGVVMLSVRMQPTILGRLLNLLYRPPHAELLVAYEDGQENSYRLIPAMAAEGFVISPLISTTSDYVMASSGYSREANLRNARSIRIDVTAPWWLGYQRKIKVAFTPLNNAALKNAEAGPIVSRKLQEIKHLELLVANNPLNGLTLTRVPEGILAHAPAILRIPVHPRSQLNLAFGIRSGAWKDGGESDGACFLVKEGEKTILERCLNPKEVEADRGEQNVSLDVPAGVSELTLETSCRVNCAWDWTYWSKAVGHADSVRP